MSRPTEATARGAPSGAPQADPRRAGGRRRRRAAAALGVVRVALGLALLAYVLSRMSAREMVAPFLAAPWLLPLLAALPLMGAAIEAERLRRLFRAQGWPLHFGSAYWLVAVATFFNFCIPGGTGGDVVKLHYLALKHRGQGMEVATVLLIDRIVALFALLVVILALAASAFGLVARQRVVGLLVLAAVAVLTAIILLTALAWSQRLRRAALYRTLLDRMPLGRYVARALNAAHAFREHKPALLAAALLSLVGHVALVAMFVVVGRQVLPAASTSVTALLSLLGMLANALPITPGGLGVGEAAFDQLFGGVGLAGGAVLLLAWRAGMVPLAVVGALLYIAGSRRAGAPALVPAPPLHAAPSSKPGF